jgi:hypothetical protein
MKVSGFMGHRPILQTWVSGGLGFFILFNFTSDMEEFAGRSCVSAIAILGLILLSVLINRRTREPISPS